MAYATVADVQQRLTYTLSADQQRVCAALLDDVAILIDTYNDEVLEDVAKTVSCRVVARALGDGSTDASIPVGATQGTVSALGYSQSWTIGGSGAAGEIYLTRAEKRMLGVGNKIGSWSPVQELSPAYAPQPSPNGKKVNIIGMAVEDFNAIGEQG
jgi:hypothetical protein